MQQFMLMGLTALDALLITLSQTALWQRKEYRLDRMNVYLHSPEGSLEKQYAVLLAGILLCISWGFAFVYTIYLAQLFAVMSILVIFFGHAMRIYLRGVMRPDFTSRAMFVLVTTFIFCVVYVALFLPLSEFLSLYLATFIFFLPLLIALSVYLVGIPAQMQKQKAVSRAGAYRTHLKNLIVVGITGSVGKTSTKAYLTHLLGGESERIIATSEHRNSPYSVAQDMLSRLSQKTHMYIAEMGAYIPGEIAELAQLTKPKIAIITAITNQHAALFGSLEALARTKWELIDALPKDGIAVLHKDDAQIALRSKNLKKKIVWFSATQEADVRASDIVLRKDQTICTVSIGDEKHDLTLPIISRGQMVPVLAAVAAAWALGESVSSILERLKSLPTLPRTMELRSGMSGATIVDDSYSASEASVANAIEYLKAVVSSDTRLVLVPVIELGDESKRVHEKIGNLLKNLSARVYVYGNAYQEDIMRGLGNDSKATVVWVDDAKELKEKICTGLTRETLVVLEGRIPSVVRSALL